MTAREPTRGGTAARNLSLAPLAPVLRRERAALTARLADSLRAEIPDYAAMPPGEVYAQAESQLLHVEAQFAGSPEPPTGGPEAYGKRRAEQGIALDTILRVYRIAWTELWDGLVQASRKDGPGEEWLLAASTSYLWMADQFAQRMLVAYREKSHQILLQSAARRGAMLEGIFSGFARSDELAEAAGLLNLPQQGTLLVVAAATDTPGCRALPDIENFLSVKNLHSVWRLSVDLEVGLVSLRNADLKSQVLDRLRTYPDVRIGVGPTYVELSRTPTALHLARLALGTLRPDAGGIAEFDQSAIAALLAAAPEAAREIHRTTLGALGELAEADAAHLIDTLRAWFDAGGDIPAAAQRLFVHPNTVRYRLRKLQAVTGCRIDDPREVSLLHAAVLAAGFLPSP